MFVRLMLFLSFLLGHSPVFASKSHHLTECEIVWVRSRATISHWDQWQKEGDWKSLETSLKWVLRLYNIETYEVPNKRVDPYDPIRNRLLLALDILRNGFLSRDFMGLHAYSHRRFKYALEEIQSLLKKG